jgi:hypothetical protein
MEPQAQRKRFFIPIPSPEEAKQVLEGIAKWVHREVPPPHELIFRLEFKHNGKDYVAEVGQEIDPYYQSPGPVIAIFGGNPLLICMRDRGVLKGEPIYVATQSVKRAEYFDE